MIGRALVVAAACGCAVAAERPNFVLIVADDMGWADAGFNGCVDIPTPHIDRIADGGIRFRAGYVTAAVCGPL